MPYKDEAKRKEYDAKWKYAQRHEEVIVTKGNHEGLPIWYLSHIIIPEGVKA